MFLHQDEDFKSWLVLYIPPEILTLYHATYLRQRKVALPDNFGVKPISEEEVQKFERFLNSKPKK